MITPFPVKTPPVGDNGLIQQPTWSQWLNKVRDALNLTPGNSVPVLFANLPEPVTGMILVVTDSTVNTWGSVITGGGGFTVAAFWNGTNWTVAAT